MLAKHALSQLSYGPRLGEPALGPKVRKAERPPRPVARIAKWTDVHAGD